MRARCACVPGACGGRYEDFSNLADWQAFVARSKAAIDRALPIVTRAQMPLAVENHKDWTAQELAGLIKNDRANIWAYAGHREQYRAARRSYGGD